MLILTCKLGNEIINCYDGTHNKEQLKKWSSKKILLCPVCGKPYEYCHGKVKTPYFRHMDKAECEDKYSESETEEHLNGKRDLFEWIKKQKGVTNAVLEGWIPETKQRPDIMFEYGGKKCVIEYQCSPIATEYVERHELYQASGIIDIWIAGYEKYFKPNSRHKFLEDYIDGYYNPETNIFKIGNGTDQYKFMDKISMKRKSFHLNSFVFEGYSVILKTYKDKDFDNLYDLHITRKNNAEENIQNRMNESESRIKSISKYVEKFNGTFGKYHYYSNKSKTIFYLYGNNNSNFYKLDVKTEKKGFYKRIFDIKRNIEIAKLLDDTLCNFENDNWSFCSYFSDKGDIDIYVTLHPCFPDTIDSFNSNFKINHSSINNIMDGDSIKEILLPHMRECLEKGRHGNSYIRIMEVKDN